jgi:hypothetical protein
MSGGGIFYVYEHWRPDTDTCFYVGKGKGRRANVMYSRNNHHTHIQKKLAGKGMCVEVRLVAEGLSEEEAFAIEVERIAFWLGEDIDLANLTSGGEGGADPSEETRTKMRQAKIGKTLTAEHKKKIAESTKVALNKEGMSEKLSIAIKDALSKPEAKKNRSAGQKARVRTKEHYDKVSKALTGRKLSPEHVEKMRLGKLGKKQSHEEIERRRLANTGKKRTEEQRQRMREGIARAKERASQ